MDEADAWYSGLEARLIDFYGGPAAPKPDSQGRVSTSFAKFWSRRVIDEHTSRQRVHIPIHNEIAATSADLLFGEAIHFTSDNTQAQDRLEEIGVNNRLDSLLLEAADVAAGIGGVYLRAGWDRDLEPAGPILDVVHGDHAVPTFRRGRLVDVTFWRELLNDKGKIWRHLEHHTRGVIVHRLYVGNKDRIGVSRPLNERPETAGLVGDDGADEQGLVRLPDALAQQLSVAYVPNMLPNKRHRGWPVGVADTLGAVDVMDAIDEIETSWVRDVRLGKQRIIVPDEFLERRGRGKGAQFDLDAEVFTGLEMDPQSRDKATIETFMPDVRWEAHANTLTQHLEFTVNSAGYSPSTFGLIGDVSTQRTATEISARQDRTRHTLNRKRGYFRDALEHTARVLLELDRALFQARVGDIQELDVVWPEADTDPHRVAETVDLLRRAQAASTRKLVEIAQPQLEGDALDEEVQRVLEENGLAVTNPDGRPAPPGAPSGDGRAPAAATS